MTSQSAHPAEHGSLLNPIEPTPLAGATKRAEPKQADVLVQLAEANELFVTQDDEAFTDIQHGGVRQTLPVQSKAFKKWLVAAYYDVRSSVPSSEALKGALGTIEGLASRRGGQRPVFTRVAAHNDKLYVDLANDRWQAAEISPAGWAIIDQPPVRFRRTSSTRPLPSPMRGGFPDELRELLNIQSDHDFVLVMAWLWSAMKFTGPFPVMVVTGEQGSAKSSFSEIIKSLIDPNKAPIRSFPKGERELVISAKNGHVLAFDNVSSISPDTSDSLCRLSTGAGFATRQLFTDDDEIVIEVQKPIILNGIGQFVARPDLADRAIFIHLPPIPSSRRCSKSELAAKIANVAPRILACLFDAASEGLKNQSAITRRDHPRMADFFLWSIACETAAWPTGTFEKAYELNRKEAIENTLDNDQVAAAVIRLAMMEGAWEGTPTQLCERLKLLAGDGGLNPYWPKTPNALSTKLDRLASFLRTVGVEISRKRLNDRNRTRLTRIATTKDFACERPSASSGRPQEPESAGQNLDDADDADARFRNKSSWQSGF